MHLKKNLFWDYVALIFVFLVSGSVYCFVFNSSLFVPLFFAFSFVYWMRKKNKHIEKRALRFLLAYVFLLTVSYMFVGTPHSSTFSIFIVYILLAVGSFFLMQSFEYDRFRKTYLNVVTFIAITSIILYAMQQLGLLPLRTIFKPGAGRYMVFAFNNFGWLQPFNRLAGPYWEPGVFQIVLSFALFFYFDEIARLDFSRVSLKKLLIVLLAIILTKSTAGYVNLVILLFLLMISMKSTKKSFLKYICLCVISVFACVFLLSSDTYQKKMNQKGNEGTSYEIRKADNLAMLQMTIEKPLLGYGLASMEYQYRGKSLGNITSSNGLLFMSAQMGIPFLILFVLTIYINLKRIYPNKTILFLFYFLMLHVTEVYFYFPIALTIFFLREPEKGKGNQIAYLQEKV